LPHLIVTVEVRQCVVERKNDAEPAEPASPKFAHVVHPERNVETSSDGLRLGPFDFPT
jgi:hypothetical protein